MSPCNFKVNINPTCYFQNILEGRLLSLSLHPTGNYIIQKLLSSCQDKAEFDAWFEKELDAGVEDILGRIV